MIKIRKANISDINSIVNLRNEFDIYHKKFDKLVNTDLKRKKFNRRFINRKIKNKNAIKTFYSIGFKELSRHMINRVK